MNSPEFTNPVPGFNFTLRLPKQIPIGTLIYKVRAVDKDSNENGQTVYSIESVIYEESRDVALGLPLAINPHTGEIRVNNSLKDSKTGQYRLTLLVRDRGCPPVNSSSSFIIFLVESESQEEQDFNLLGMGQLKFIFIKSNANLFMLFGIFLVFIFMSIILIITILVLARKQKKLAKQKKGQLENNINGDETDRGPGSEWPSSKESSHRGSGPIGFDFPYPDLTRIQNHSMEHIELGLGSGSPEHGVPFLCHNGNTLPYTGGYCEHANQHANGRPYSNSTEESCFLPIEGIALP